MLLVEKTYIGLKDRSWRKCALGKTLVAKYLGVNIKLGGRNFNQHKKDVARTARQHVTEIMGLTRAGLDWAQLLQRGVSNASHLVWVTDTDLGVQ